LTEKKTGLFVKEIQPLGLEDFVGKVTLEKEDSQDKTARLTRENRDHWVRIIKELLLFLVGLVGAVLIVMYCISIVNDNSSPKEIKEWAMAIISGLVSGLVGYLLGKRTD
jgi:hypothetical protein